MAFSSHSPAIAAPIVVNTAASNGVATLKWLVVLRSTCVTISAISMPSARNRPQLIAATNRGRSGMNVSIQRSVAP